MLEGLMNRYIGIGLGILVCGCSKQDCQCGAEGLKSQVDQRVVEVDPLVQELEAGDWRFLEQAYNEISNGRQGEERRQELLRLHKRALAVDFEKIEKRVHQEWTEKDESSRSPLNTWTEERDCNRALTQAYGCLYGLTSDIGMTLWVCGDFSKRMWDVWFDYIEKMAVENQRLKRDRLDACELAIRQIERCRTEYYGGLTPQLDKDVDEWLHEKFLRLVGRPMANGK